MIVQPSALEACLVRIYNRDGTVVGAGFLVGGKHVVTCAHVVRNALRLPDDHVTQPQETVRLDFPLIEPKQFIDAQVVQWPHTAAIDRYRGACAFWQRANRGETCYTGLR